MRRYLTLFLLTTALLFTGCGDSEDFVFTNNNVLGPAPVAVNDAYTTNQDTTLTVNSVNGVLANDTPNGGTVTSFDATSTQNGTVSVNGNGSFTYTPPNSFTGPDTFAYTVTNNRGSSTATVTITVQAVNGYFVDAVNGNDGTGSFNGGLPFQSIQAAVAAAPTNADIIVLSGNYTGGINLKDGQRLLGSGSNLVNPQGSTRPQLTGPIDLADSNTLDFLRIEGTSGDAVTATNQNNGIVTNCEFANTTTGGSTGTGLFTDNVSGNWNVEGNTFNGLAGTAVAFRVTGTDVATILINNNSMTNNGLAGIVIISEDDAEVKTQVHGNTFSGNNTVTGDAFEIEVRGDSYIGLDLEDNTNDGIYSLFVTLVGAGELDVEQLNDLTTPKPTGAGNTGTVQPTGKAPNPIPNNTLFP